MLQCQFVTYKNVTIMKKIMLMTGMQQFSLYPFRHLFNLLECWTF